MAQVLNSFKIAFGNNTLDYRLGEDVNLSEIKLFFQRSYHVQKIWNGGRHVLGILIKNGITYFLKLSTSEGIGIVTKNEYHWNDYFTKYFSIGFPYRVPQNYDKGVYNKKYFYIITNYFEGELLCGVDSSGKDFNLLTEKIPFIIELSELIQKMPNLGFNSLQDKEGDYKKRFVNKVCLWFNDIPEDIRKKYKVEILLEIVKKEIGKLLSKPRHGDFAPWHILNLREGRLGLIDGEHAVPNSVENYDICYFIQRVFSILKNPLIAQDIYSRLLMRGYKRNKLKTILAARAIGGFLDESLSANPNFEFANNFRDWVM